MDIAESQCVAGSNNEANRCQLQLVSCATFFFFSFSSPVVWLNGYCMKLTMSILLLEIMLVIHHRLYRSFTPALENPSPLLQVASRSYFETTV